MRFVTRFSFLALFAVATAVIAAPRAAVPTLSVEGDDGLVALSLESLRVDVLIRGHLARTTYELTYRNAADQNTDGDFTFPLPRGAEVSDIGLYFNGHLRHGVAVERVQARAIYEDTVHRRVDPALAEWSSSTRAFHFRVFPIAAKSAKVVRIAIDQELTPAPYELDLRFDTQLAEFDLDIDSDTRVDADGIDLRRSQSGWSAHQTGTRLNGVVRAARADSEIALAAWSPEDKTWYASAPVRIRSGARPFDPAPQVTLLYDVSSSAVQRDDAKLRAFLAAFLAKQAQGARVRIVPFHIAVEPAQETDAIGLDRTLATIPTAGATNLTEVLERLPSIAASSPAGSRILLVTDGVNTLGDAQRLARATEALAKLRRPLTIVNASPAADDNFLGRLARAAGAATIDLMQTDPLEAADEAMHGVTRTSVSTQIPLRDMLPQSIAVTSDTVVALSARSRERIVVFPVITANGRRDVPVREVESPDERDLVRRAWARARLRALLDAGANPDDVLAHGREFNQLTPRTSLLVLETWWDYERNGLPIPPDLRAERDAEQAAWEAQQRLRSMASSIEIRGTTKEAPPRRAAWYLRGMVIIDDAPLPGATVTLQTSDGSKDITVSDATGRFWLTAPKAPTSFTITSELTGLNTMTRSYPRGAPKGALVEIVMRLASVAESITVTAEAPGVTSDSLQIDTPRVAPLIRRENANIADRLLSSLASDAPLPEDEDIAKKSIAQRLDLIDQVVAKIRSLSSLDERFRYYVAARSVVGGDKLFQANAALAIRDEAPDMAVRWLTDLVEAYPDDAPTLRILGRVLDGWGRGDLARLLFDRALELSPEETQTARERTLLESKETYGVDARIDPSAELQIESMWDSNYTDVDLHVIEPDGEEVYFAHRESKHSGRLHEDIRTGFGPETYTLPRLQPGRYRIELHYYAGDTTRATMQTLSHVIVYVRGQRRDLFVTLTSRDEKRVVAIIE